MRFLSTIRGRKQEYRKKAGVKLSISSFYERFTPKIVGLISFRGACSMRLSFKHSNPVVFWAIAINTSVGTLAQGLHPAYRSWILQVPFLRQNRPLWRLFRQQAEKNANQYTHLRWTKVFTEQADRLLTAVLECVGLKLEPICSLNTTFTSVRDAIQMSNERS